MSLLYELLIYAAIGLITFKSIYFFSRSKDLARLEVEKIELQKAKAELNKNPFKESQESDGSYDRWRFAEMKHSNAQRTHRAALEEVESNTSLTMSSIAGALWPFSLAGLIAFGLWKVLKYIFFYGDMDKAARKRATRLTAGKWEQYEKEKEQARLLEVAKEEGLIPVEED